MLTSAGLISAAVGPSSNSLVFSRSSTNSALGYSFLVVPLLVFLVLLTNKMDETVKISYFAAASPLFLTFFTLIITSFGSRGKLK